MRHLLALLAVLLVAVPVAAQSPEQMRPDSILHRLDYTIRAARSTVTQMENLRRAIEAWVADRPGIPILRDTIVVTDTVVVYVPAPEPPAVPEEAPTPTPAAAGSLVAYPSPEVEAILGPQLRAGSESNPWPWFDANATAHGAKLWDSEAAKERSHGYYYDHALAQYLNYHRTGDEAFQTRARAAADYWYEQSALEKQKFGGYNPREAALDGLMLRALDGRPEYWPFITAEVERHYSVWLGKRLAYPELYFGVRDGGYALLYAARLAQVHPDTAVRAAYRAKALTAARDYYARLQSADGGWYWKDGGDPWEQPFMVGLLLEGMIEVHEITGDAAVRASILASVDHLWSRYRSTEVVPEPRGQGARWRQVGYFNFPDGRVQGETKLSGEVRDASGVVTKAGWDTNTIREGRQRNTLVVHAFGYAYHLTRDPKYREWGDEIFAATYGNGQGPGADPWYSLADFRGKEYNQAYRSAGRYLAWRLN